MDLDHEPVLPADGMDIDDTSIPVSPHTTKDEVITEMMEEDGDAEMEGDEEEYEEYYEAEDGEGTGEPEYDEDEEMHEGVEQAGNAQAEGEGAGEVGDVGDEAAYEEGQAGSESHEGAETAYAGEANEPSGSVEEAAESTTDIVAGVAPAPELVTSRASPSAQTPAAGQSQIQTTSDAAAGSEDPTADAAVAEAKDGIANDAAAGTSGNDEVPSGAKSTEVANAPATAASDHSHATAEHDGDTVVGAEAGEDEGAADETIEEEGEEDEDIEELLTIHNLPPVLIHPPSGPPKLLFWTPEDHEVYSDIIDAELEILLEGKHETYGNAKLDMVFGQIKVELGAHLEVPEGVEMVLEERALGLKMGEHDKHLSHITLLELLQVHHSCELPLPVHLYLTFESSRFYDRFEAIRRELVVRAERRQLGENEQDEYELGEGDVRDDEGYESGEDAEDADEDEEEYEEGDEAEAHIHADAAQGSEGKEIAGVAAEHYEDSAPTGDDANDGSRAEKGAAAGGAAVISTEPDNQAASNMSHIPDDPEVPLDAAALVEYQALQAEEQALDPIAANGDEHGDGEGRDDGDDAYEGADGEEIVDETPLGDVEVQELHEDREVENDGEPVIVPDETTAEADEDDGEPEAPVPADLEDAVVDTAPDAEATLAPEDDSLAAGDEEVAYADEAGDAVQEDAAEGDGVDAGAGDEIQGEEGYEASEGGEGDFDVKEMANKPEQDALVELAQDRDPDEPEAGLAMAYRDDALGEEAIREVAGDEVADDIVEAGVEPVDELDSPYSDKDNLNPFESYDAGDREDVDEGYEGAGDDVATHLSVKRPLEVEDEDEGVDVEEGKGKQPRL